VPVLALMYHDVTPQGGADASGFPGGDAARYKLDTSQFDEHLEALRALEGCCPALVDGLDPAAIARLPDRLVLLTFDDGGVSAEAIADRLEALGWRGHFFVTASCINRRGFLTVSQVRRLHDRGHVVGSHSWSHPLRMARLPAAQIRDEWFRSTEQLASIIGEPVRTASVPGGSFSRRVAATAAEAGVRTLFTSRPTSQVRLAEGLAILGRYAVRRSTAPATVARVAAGAPLPRLSQLVLWDVATILKRVGGPMYLRARGRLLGSSRKARWGEDSSVAIDER
jgi:peptidoglycan/xylan/chitin deacetylase (PgdA/CDA1 family)